MNRGARAAPDTPAHRRILRAALAYYAIVFGAGFLLAFVRLPLLVPRVGVRTAELIETPVMLLVIALASRRLTRAHRTLSTTALLRVGLLALALLVASELLLAAVIDGRSLAAYVASRDPVSGSVYALALVVFAIAPALWRRGARR